MALWNNNGYFYGDFSLDGTRYRPRLRDPKGKRIPFNADPASPEYQKAGRAQERAMERAERGDSLPGQERGIHLQDCRSLRLARNFLRKGASGSPGCRFAQSKSVAGILSSTSASARSTHSTPMTCENM